MNYVSTRGNCAPIGSAQAINLGMVPEGGLFVPETVPKAETGSLFHGSYQETALRLLAPMLDDFGKSELENCVQRAYNSGHFDCDTIINMSILDKKRSILELWHGPTAAFKDMALQIMPHFLGTAKQKVGERSHTVILVATSGDTGTAALEGFRDCEGISIIVFYPHGGVSEIQRLQMATTEGNNTHVVAVKGNFDDCQTAVKDLFGDMELRRSIESEGFAFSSANSINWGRLCPQIVYYARAYAMLTGQGVINSGDPVNFCVPTGNFGNILAGYYAKQMGLPVGKLICASNKNKVLADFFTEGKYDRNRRFFRTMSPSMDILISSNLERFLFEITGHDSARIRKWYGTLAKDGTFRIDDEVKRSIDKVIIPGWVDEPRVLETIGAMYRSTGYVLDTHTAVAAAVAQDVDPGDCHTVIVSTASPFKFSGDVLAGLGGEKINDEFESLERLSKMTGEKIRRALEGLREKPVRHDLVIDVGRMRQTVMDIIGEIDR